MYSGHMLFALGAIVLLGKLALSGNWLISESQGQLWKNETIQTATGIGEAMIEKIEVRGFDEKARGGSDTVSTSTLSSSLGPDILLGDTVGKPTSYDDIDDFKGFSDSVSTPRFGKFYVSCNVDYVNESSPYAITASRTFIKCIAVTVTNNYMVDANDASRKLTSAITLTKYISYR